MKANNYQTVIGVTLISFLIFNVGCNKSSSTGPGNSQISGNGSDYFPLTGNQAISAQATYQEVVYDSTGKLMESNAATDQDVKGYIALATTISGMQGYPLYGYGQDGTTLVPSNVVAAQDSGAIVLLQQVGQYFILLPRTLEVGTKWVANPFSPADEQVTLQITGGKSSYTNSAGKTYSNVITVNATYSDSVMTPSDYSYHFSSTDWYSYHGILFNKTTASANIYFAKGVGLVDFQVNQFEETLKYSEVDSSNYSYNTPPLQVSYYSRYDRIVGSATCGRTDSPSGSIVQKGTQNSLEGMNVQKAPKKISLIDLLFGNRKAFQRVPHVRH